MHTPLLSLCIPWIGCLEFSWRTLLVATVTVLAGIRYMWFITTYDFSRNSLESFRWEALWHTQHHLPHLKKKAADRDPEIDHDSEWASAYSVAIDRHLVSACFALDALDRDWPWDTAEVRKAYARAEKCADVTHRHSSAAFQRFLDVTNNLERLAEKD